MNRNKPITLILGLLLIFTGFWAYPKINHFFKIDRCLDRGGKWNYETNECESDPQEKHVLLQKTDSTNSYNQPADEQNRSTYTVSAHNTDLENATINRPEKTKITNPTIDTTKLFKIWTLTPDGPHADFWIKSTEFYIVDYDGDGAMQYILDHDRLTIFHNDFIQKGKIVSVSLDTLKILWDASEKPTLYIEWKN